MEKYFDASYIWSAFPQLLPYLKITFLVTILAVFFGTLLGFMIAFMKMSKNKIAQKLANAYITVIRCTPSVVLLFLVFYGIPTFSEGLFGINLQDIHIGIYVVLTFSLMFGGMMAEVIRSAIESVDKGQYEAAVSVGLTSAQAYRRIVFPQAFVTAIPNFANGFIGVLQEGALAYTIGFIDIVGKANLIISNNYGTHMLEIYLALVIIYWLLTLILERIFYFLERFFTRGYRGIKSA